MTATVEPAAPSARGIVCARCRGRLSVYCVRKPCAGKVVRYRECEACGYRCVTVEKISHTPKVKHGVPTNDE